MARRSILDVQKILSEGITLRTSGTTGRPKEIFQTPAKLKAANITATDSQQLTKSSRVYTVCKTAHAGGLLAQTLPALAIGAEVIIEDFNAYHWAKAVNYFTHSHLTPDHCRAIMLTKSWRTLDLTGIWITCVSDRVTWDIIEAFVTKGATFMVNWGMTEIGPCAVNIVFDSMDKVQHYKSQTPSGTTILGNRYYCNINVQDKRLSVHGDICIYDDWFDTGDLVEFTKSGLFYHGRK